MKVEVCVKTSETTQDYFKSEVRLTILGKNSRSKSYLFTVSAPGTDQQQIIVRKGKQIFFNFRGVITDDNPEMRSVNDELAILMCLTGKGISQTIQNIQVERESSQGAADEAAKLWEQMGMSSEIMDEAKDTYEIPEPEKQSHIEQLFAD